MFTAGISQRKNEMVRDECYMSATFDNNTGARPPVDEQHFTP
jgi:hypothetical protein